MKSLGGMVADALFDPERRKHVVMRVIETVVPSFLVIFLLTFVLWKAVVGATVIVILELLFFDYVLERYTTWTGNYWERPAREDGTPFVRP